MMTKINELKEKIEIILTIAILSMFGQYAYAGANVGVGVQGKVALAREEIKEFELTKQAEMALKEIGYEAIKVDGVTDDRERRTIYTYQKYRGLPLSGEFDSETLDSLNITYEL